MKELFRSGWLAIRQTDDGYDYVHAHKMGGQAVAVLGYDDDSGAVLGRFERCPPHGEEVALCSLTGGIDSGEEPVEAAARELYEESGFEVDVTQLVPLGTVRPSKSSDTVMHLFAALISAHSSGDLGAEHQGPGDGSEFEKGSYCKFVSVEEAVMCKDPLVATMLMRLAVMEDQVDV